MLNSGGKIFWLQEYVQNTWEERVGSHFRMWWADSEMGEYHDIYLFDLILYLAQNLTSGGWEGAELPSPTMLPCLAILENVFSIFWKNSSFLQEACLVLRFESSLRYSDPAGNAAEMLFIPFLCAFQMPPLCGPQSPLCGLWWWRVFDVCWTMTTTLTLFPVGERKGDHNGGHPHSPWRCLVRVKVWTPSLAMPLP